MIRIEIDTKNDAFREHLDDVSRILRGIARRLEEGELERGEHHHVGLRDSNGNTVGFLEMKEND